MKRTLIILLSAGLLLVSIGGMDPVRAGQPQSPTGSGRAESQPKPAPPETDRFAPVRALILETMKSTGIASLSIAAAERGDVVWEESFGYAHKKKDIKALPQSVYALASISKSFTGTGLMVLAERGLIDPDKPLNDYLGGAKLVSYAGDASQATLMRVLHMEAGLPMHWNLFFAPEPAQPLDMEESIRRYGIIVNTPGEEYVYSNFAYGILDHVISRISGKDYADFMKTEVFQPLGLTRTFVYPEPALAGSMVQGYDERGRPVSAFDCDHRGASSVYASVEDLIRYGMFHLKDRVPGQKAILGPKALDRLHEPSTMKILEENVGDVHMAWGWATVDVAGYRFLLSTGSAPGTQTRLALIPAKDVAVAILVNSSSTENLAAWKIEWATFAALLPGFPEPPRPRIPAEQPRTFSPPPEIQGEWKGTIKTYQGEVPFRLSVAGQVLKIEVNGRLAGPVPMATPLGGLTFENGWLSGLFFGTIPTADAKRSASVIFLRLKLRGKNLEGTASAVAVNQSFSLPYWAQLTRVSGR